MWNIFVSIFFLFELLNISVIKCTDFNSSLTHQNVDSKPLQEIEGFNSPYIKSGPVVIINEKIIFIPSIYYNEQINSNFYVGSGIPYENRILIEKEYNGSNILPIYNGENIYLKLPDSIKKFDYLGVWSDMESKDLGYISFDSLQKEQISTADDYFNKTVDGKEILRVPRCCRTNRRNNCTEDCEFHFNITVHEHNSTHLNNETMNVNKYVLMPYNYFYPPEMKFFVAEPDDVYLLLKNTSLFIILGSTYKILSHNEYCFLITKSNTELHFFPQEEDEGSNKAAIVFQVLITISTICFALTAILYWFVFKVKGVHKICFVCYASMMALTFLLMSINQFGGNIACSVIGSFFLFFINCSYGFLFFLCWDLQYIIKEHKEIDNIDYKRLYYYIGGSFAYASLVLIISLVPDGVPDVPKFFNSVENGCQYHNTNDYIFFVPLLLVVILSAACLIYCGILVRQKNKIPDYSWMKIVINIKYIFRSYIVLLLLMILWLAELILRCIIGELQPLIIVESCQGIITMCIFVFNKYARDEAKKNFDIQFTKLKNNETSTNSVYFYNEFT